MICRPDFYNLQTRKKTEKAHVVRIELSISINTKLFQILINALASGYLRNQSLNLYDLLTDKKVTKIVT